MEKPVVTLADARSYLVKRYRAEGGARLWPDGIDAMDPAKGEQWYRGHEHEWLDDGTYIGNSGVLNPVTSASSVTMTVTTSVTVSDKPRHSDYPDHKTYLQAYMRWKRSQPGLQK